MHQQYYGDIERVWKCYSCGNETNLDFRDLCGPRLLLAVAGRD